MKKRDELSDPNSCMSRAHDDEWTFVLLGRDLSSIVAVEAWIKDRLWRGKNTKDDPQIKEALLWCASVKMDLQSKGVFRPFPCIVCGKPSLPNKSGCEKCEAELIAEDARFQASPPSGSPL